MARTVHARSHEELLRTRILESEANRPKETLP